MVVDTMPLKAKVELPCITAERGILVLSCEG